MKQFFLTGLAASLSFLVGLTVNSSSDAQKSPSNQNVLNAQATSAPTPCPQTDEYPKLIDDKYITTFNGPKLALYYDSNARIEDVPFSIESAKISALADGGLLASLGNSLYRFDRHHHVVWRYYSSWMIFDYDYVEATNLIYGTASDNVMFIVDAATGKEKHSESRNGSASYGVAVKYGDDMCLVTDNNVMYREKFRGDNIEPMKDGITCWQGTKILWHLDFPPDAELVVNGKRILAVTKSKKAIYVNEITPLQTKSE
jgi:hypothetical protein